jgi:dihydropyrimidine dehydrogenase (NAD+) subunit PreA
MHRGFGVVKAMTRGLEKWMDEKGFATIDQAVGKALPRIKDWGELDLNYKVVAKINQATCIHCGICFASCEDGCYQAIAWDKLSPADYTSKFGEPNRLKGEAAPNLQLNKDGRAIDVFTVRDDACVGCNMCALACPVDGCITMEEVSTGNPPMSWNQYQTMLKAGKVNKIAPKKAVKV